MATASVDERPVEIFISYAHQDRKILAKLCAHLRSYETSGQIRVWCDRKLRPGIAWEPEIYAHFRSSRIIVLLVSANFFASDYCQQCELPAALQRNDERDAIVIPVVARTCHWQHTALGKLQALPLEGRAIDRWPNREEAFASVAQGLWELARSLSGQTDHLTDARHLWNHPPGTVAESPETVPESTQPPGIRVAPAAIPSIEPADNLPAVSVPSETSVSVTASPHSTVASEAQPTPEAAATPVVTATLGTTTARRSTVPLGVVSPAAPLPPQDIPQVVICLLHPQRQDTVLRLRKWCHVANDPVLGTPAAHVVKVNQLSEALERVHMAPSSTILVLDGFEPDCQQLDELVELTAERFPQQVIVNHPEWQAVPPTSASASASSSMWQPAVRAVTTDATLLPAVRKYLLRVRARQLSEARVLATPAELESFFRLRYEVWRELHYLAPHKVCPELPWELDYTDRTSLPWGVFSRQTGQLIGGARLVRGFGEDAPQLVQTINRMLEARKVERLIDNFRYPQAVSHPFDILGELSRFKEYYRDLVLRKVAKAEVSRVVVTPDYRRLGMGEVIVDSLCSVARSWGIQVLFLACHQRHADFYRRCGFQEVPNVVGERFLTYDVPCIAMEKSLTILEETLAQPPVLQE